MLSAYLLNWFWFINLLNDDLNIWGSDTYDPFEPLNPKEHLEEEYSHQLMKEERVGEPLEVSDAALMNYTNRFGWGKDSRDWKFSIEKKGRVLFLYIYIRFCFLINIWNPTSLTLILCPWAISKILSAIELHHVLLTFTSPKERDTSRTKKQYWAKRSTCVP